MSMTRSAPKVRAEQERGELDAILRSGILGKAPNLQRFLDYVAERYFAGEADQVKEYSIAVNALKRPETFDPQSDTIVRVTAHTLRKRLEQFYANEGKDRAIQMQLPAGRYVLRFVHREEEDDAEDDHSAPNAEVESQIWIPEPACDPPEPQKAPFTRWKPLRWVALVLGLLVCALAIYMARPPRRAKAPAAMTTTEEAALQPARQTAVQGGAPPQTVESVLDSGTLNFRVAENVPPYTDTAGRVWASNSYCTGGTSFTHAPRPIDGTDDPAIYLTGRSGRFECKFPEPPGFYQLELLFADTVGDKEAAGQVVFTINGGPVHALDVVDEAGGDDKAIGKVYAGIAPEPDGMIHLDFLSDAAFVNAVQITPAPSRAMLPLRMVAGPSMVRDSEGKLWSPEQFFFGGRRTFHPDNLPKVADAKLFQWERFGHFRYELPVEPDKEYTIKLFFSEGWFGATNGGPGGPGSRTFDVYCNGTTLLSNFDILQTGPGAPLIVPFHHVRPTAKGFLELLFTPVTNYPLINAVEVDPES